MKIAFIFPGQGTQYVGMGKELYENSCDSKLFLDKIFESLDIDLKKVMFEGPEEELKKTNYTQPAIVALSLVLTNELVKKGIKADFVAGHSLGEYSALGAAGMLDSQECVKLTASRGQIMQEVAERVDGTMAAVIGLASDKIEKACSEVDGLVEAVNYNEPKQTVIAGEKSAVKKIESILIEKGAKRFIVLSVAGPFHSKLMEPAAIKLKEKLEEFSFKNSSIPIVANTDTRLITDFDSMKEELYNQAFGPVKWVDTIKKLSNEGVETLYEIGPGKVLKGLVRKIDKNLKVINIESLEDIQKI